jgi:hypothetical protein
MAHQPDKQRIRQALEAALAGLDDSTATSSISPDAGAPLVIVLGNARSQGQSAEPDKDALKAAAASHPGLQKFVMLETESSSPAPKSCFMEPERDCVHSGACEMRGF